MFNTILFDLDGTLTDPGEGIVNSVIYALNKYGITVDDREKLYEFIGPPLQDSFKILYGFDENKAFEAVNYFREYFKVKGINENEIYDNIVELLVSLKKMNKRLVIATSKPEGFTHQVLKNFGIDKYFEFVAAATMDGSRSKKSDIIKYALDSLNITNKDEVVMIGDRKQDIIGAKENGIQSIGVLYGYGTIEEHMNAGATFICKEVLDILKIIEEV